MKYLRQAKKNGNLAPLLTGMLVLTGLGVTMVVVTVYELVTYGELQSFVAPLTGIAALANLPAGRIAVGAYVAYLGFFALPRWSRYAQLPEEYKVSVDETHINIIFRKWSWRVKRETFQPGDLFFRDGNHKFVSVSRGYQVYNAMLAFYPEYIGTGKVPDKRELGSIEDFHDVRKMTVEERRAYAREKKKGNGFSSACMGGVSLIFGGLAVKIFLMLPQKITLGEKMPVLLLGLFLFLLFLLFFMMAVSAKMEARWMRTHDCFVATGYSYNKSKEQVQDGTLNRTTVYYAKVWDGHSVYLKRTFEISREDFAREEPLTFELRFYKDKRGYTEIDARVK